MFRASLSAILFLLSLLWLSKALFESTPPESPTVPPVLSTPAGPSPPAEQRPPGRAAQRQPGHSPAGVIPAGAIEEELDSASVARIAITIPPATVPRSGPDTSATFEPSRSSWDVRSRHYLLPAEPELQEAAVVESVGHEIEFRDDPPRTAPPSVEYGPSTSIEFGTPPPTPRVAARPRRLSPMAARAATRQRQNALLNDSNRVLERAAHAPSGVTRPADTARRRPPVRKNDAPPKYSEFYSPAQSAGWYQPLPQLTNQMRARRGRIRQCLDFYYRNRLLNTRDDSPWSMMHHMLAWGADSQIYIGEPGGRRESTIGWLCANGVCKGERLAYVQHGQIQVRLGPGLQGHEGQMLALLTQARVPHTQPLRIDGQDFTVADLIRQEQLACRPRSELSFRLIGLAHYLHSDSTWTDDRGEVWSIPRLIREEIKQPINGVTCGGTHRLMGLSYAVLRRRMDGLPVDGQWARAAQYTASYHDYAFKLQNRDGSLSSDFFRSRGSWGDVNRKVKTTGHTLEWLVFSLPHARLQDRQLTRAVDLLCNLLSRNRYYDWDNGAVSHAIRALALYDERAFGGRPGERKVRMARRPATPRSNHRGPRPGGRR